MLYEVITNLRATVGPGVGYQIWDDDRKALSVEAGVSYFIEDLKTGEDEKYATGRVGANFRYKIFDTLVFNDNVIFYPSIENTKEYSLRNEAILSRITSYNVCYTKLLRAHGLAGNPLFVPRQAGRGPQNIRNNFV